MEGKSREADLERRELLLQMKPVFEQYVQLAEAYNRMGRHVDAFRVMEQAETLLHRAEQRILRMKQNFMICGKLSMDLLVEIIQMLHHMKAAGELVLELPTITSHLYFLDGEIVHIDNGNQSEDIVHSFNAILARCEGTYHFIERDVSRHRRPSSIECSNLILHACKVLDEERAGEMEEEALEG